MIDESDVLNDLDQIRSRYDVLRELGRDGGSVVYAVRSPASGRHFAVKVMEDARSASAKAGVLHVWQAHGMGKVDHPNLMVLHAVHHLQGGGVAVAMERRRGRTLAELIDDVGPLPAGEVERILCAIAAALAYLHGRSVVHRGVSPRSILLDRESGRPLLAHFAIDARGGEAGGTPGDTASTSLPYLAPEQVEGGRPVEGRQLGPRSDVYALGMVGYAMLAGGTPTAEGLRAGGVDERENGWPRPLRAVRPDAPDHLCRAIEGCIHANPRHRWSSAHELLAQLDAPGAAVTRDGRTGSGIMAWRKTVERRVAAGRATLRDLRTTRATTAPEALAKAGAARGAIGSALPTQGSGPLGSAMNGFVGRGAPAATSSVPQTMAVPAPPQRPGTNGVAIDPTGRPPATPAVASDLPPRRTDPLAMAAESTSGGSPLPAATREFGPGLSTTAWLVAERAARSGRASEVAPPAPAWPGESIAAWIAARRTASAGASAEVPSGRGSREEGGPAKAAVDRAFRERFAGTAPRRRPAFARPIVAIITPPEGAPAAGPSAGRWRRRAPVPVLLLAVVAAGVIWHPSDPGTQRASRNQLPAVAAAGDASAPADEGDATEVRRTRLAGVLAAPPRSVAAGGNPTGPVRSPETRGGARATAPARARSTRLVLLGEPAGGEGPPVLLGEPVRFADLR